MSKRGGLVPQSERALTATAAQYYGFEKWTKEHSKG